MRHKHVYGPVMSRRLGRSLGVDLVPRKVCSYDCTYCQLGPTTVLTTERAEYFPTSEILADVASWLKQDGQTDYITLSGSGEPTLHSGLADIISAIQAMTSIPCAVLTNGSLLWVDEVAAACAEADLVLPSLDAADDNTFKRINRPHPSIAFDSMLEGLRSFGQRSLAPVWLEIMLVEGENDAPEHISEFRETIKQLAPKRVQLNTVVRPPSVRGVKPVSLERLGGIAKELGGAEIVVAQDATVAHRSRPDLSKDILGLLARRPCTVLDIAGGLGVHENEVLKHLDSLLVLKLVVAIQPNGKTFYRAAN
jgi:wyosine [tRNA(Phe)-imidazoG37] synthetase (radical SAM superfamily)